MFEILFILSSISALIQILWLISQIKSFNLFSKRNPGKPISVIIAAKNELENLKKLIPALRNQKYIRDWEVIIILDRCIDDSLAYLEKEKKNFQHLIILEQKQSDIPPEISPKKNALMKAIEIAKYDLILQTDADCYPKTDFWIKEMGESLKEDDVVVIGLSPYEKRPGFLNKIIQYDTSWTAGSMIYFARKGKAYMSLGRNQMFLKSYFHSKGGFGKYEKVHFGDDDLLIQNLDPQKKCNTCVTNDGQTVSIPESNWHDWLNQKLRHLMAGNYYPNKILKELILNYLTLPFYILLALALLFFPEYWFYCLALFLIRNILYAYLFKRLSLKSGSEINIVFIPVLDLLYICINLALGLKSRLRNNIEWR